MGTVAVRLGVHEIGYLMGVIHGRVMDGSGDPIARALYTKLVAAAVEGGVTLTMSPEPWKRGEG